MAQPDIDLNDVSESVLINELQKRIDALVENEDFHKNEELIQKFILLSSAIRDLLNNLSESDLKTLESKLHSDLVQKIVHYVRDDKFKEFSRKWTDS